MWSSLILAFLLHLWFLLLVQIILFDLFDNISFFYYSFVFSFVRRVFRCAAISSPSVAVPSREYVFDFVRVGFVRVRWSGCIVLCVLSHRVRVKS